MREDRIAGFPALVADGRRDRPLLLLMHGAFSTHEPFRPWLRIFATHGWRAVAVARRGRLGLGPAKAAGLQFSDYLEDSRRVIEALGEPPVLIGHSLGGLIAQKLAEEGRCAAAVLLAPAPPRTLVPSLNAIRALAPLVPGMLIGKPVDPRASICEQIALNRVSPSERKRICEGLVHESGIVFREMILGKVRVDATKVRCPIRVIAASEDRVIPPWLAAWTAEQYRAEFVMHENYGHWLIEEPDTEAIASDIIRWLDGITLGAAALGASALQLGAVQRGRRTRADRHEEVAQAQREVSVDAGCQASHPV